ncbi:hypothetical protein [Actinoplanes sp. NPDC051851]|uniref:hypothetical protein n=1 Tax=Actinoplanes sp. NPDC051851 TaxID=3154753 RepID=UPI003416416C
MTTTLWRASVLRSLPALLALVLAFFAAPASAVQLAGTRDASVSTTAVAHSVPATETPAAQATVPEPPALSPVSAGAPVEDRTRELRSQVITGTTGSRAPPAAVA